MQKDSMIKILMVIFSYDRSQYVVPIKKGSFTIQFLYKML